MSRKSAIVFLVCGVAAFFMTLSPLSAQDFGFSEDSESSLSSSVSISGDVSATALGYIDEFSSDIGEVSIGDLFSGSLNLSASVGSGEAVVNMDYSDSEFDLDEAYVGAFFGDFEIEAGLRKLTWGKADSFGPLDVINPLDTTEIYTEMADSSDLNDVKIARPLLHGTYRFGEFSKLEAVFEPSFEPYNLAESGRWASSEMTLLLASASEPDTTTLKYFQGGVRFTTTIGSADVGIQYFYGYLQEPAVDISIDTSTSAYNIDILYNPYHQIGLDCAVIIAGFNVRAELGANITPDLSGDDGSVYNPALVGSLGFDRDLFLGINLNLQVNESFRLLNDGIGSSDYLSDDFDIEADTDSTSTEIFATLSRRFFRDELEARTVAIVEVEDQDYLIMPALIWTKDDVIISCAAGIFGGNEDGQLGQYDDNDFVKVSMTYKF